MVQKSLGRVPRLVIALGAVLSMASSPVLAQSPAAQRGLTFVRVHCAQCHAIDKVSDSPLTIAPPFRTLHLKFPIESLRRRLAEGIVADHPTMPQFRLDPDQIADVIAICRRSSPDGSWLNPARAPFREPVHLTENRLEFDLDQDLGLRSAQQCKRPNGRRIMWIRNP
jgi:cytochrome c